MPTLPVRCLLAPLLAAACSLTAAASLPVRALPPEDAQALRELERRVDEASRRTREWALERALDGVAIKEKTSEFENAPPGEAEEEAGETDYRFPKRRPRGVRPDEWKALQAFGAGGGAAGDERGIARYSLLDIDGDGLRDLIVHVYNGGTSLVWQTTALRRKGARFAMAGSGFHYQEAGRGANQEASWIRLNGRVYVALREGRHGQDKVVLVRPFARTTVRPSLTLRYRYEMGDPAPEETHDRHKTPPPLSPALRRTLAEAIARANSGATPERPLCSLPAGQDPEDEPGLVSPHYFMEHVGAAAVSVDGRCHVGQLTDWYGHYTPQGLMARFCLLLPGGTDQDNTCYAVGGKRTLVGTVSSAEKN